MPHTEISLEVVFVMKPFIIKELMEETQNKQHSVKMEYMFTIHYLNCHYVSTLIHPFFYKRDTFIRYRMVSIRVSDKHKRWSELTLLKVTDEPDE